MNGAIETTIADFPGFAEAVAREAAIRAASCLGANELICGFEVRALTAAHVHLLNLVCSPFLFAYPVAALKTKPDVLLDIMRFLWVVSPDFVPGSLASPHLPRRWFESRRAFNARLAAADTPRDRFNRAFASLMKVPAETVIASILEYVEEAFIDSPDNQPGGKSFYAQELAIAYEMSKHHGYRLDFWHRDCPADKNPLHVPLKIVFQLRKLRRESELGQDAGLTNKSDKLIADGLSELVKRRAIAARLNDPDGVNACYGLN